MAGAPNMFPSFWDAYEKFFAKQMPAAAAPAPPAEPPAEPAASPEAPGTMSVPGTTVTAPQDQGVMFNGQGEADPFAGPGDLAPDFVKRREAVWNRIVELMIPIEVLKEVDVRELDDINADNLSEIEQLVQGYLPPKRGKK